MTIPLAILLTAVLVILIKSKVPLKIIQFVFARFVDNREGWKEPGPRVRRLVAPFCKWIVKLYMWALMYAP